MEQTSLGVINPRRWLVLAVVVAAQFMYVVDTFIVNVAIPSIRADLNASTAQIESVIAIYQIAYASMVITGGRLGDMYGPRRLFLIGLVGFIATSLACGFAPTGTALILARLAQGLTAALMVPQVLATIHSLFPDAARSRAFAIFGIALGLGGAVGFIVGGWLVTLNPAGLGWRTIFFVNGPIGVLLVLAAAMADAAADTSTNAHSLILSACWSCSPASPCWLGRWCSGANSAGRNGCSS